MTEAHLDKVNLKERIKARLEKVQEQIATLEAEQNDKPDFGMGKGDPQVYEWEMRLARLEKLHAEESDLMTALERLEAGSYGICEACGRPISLERLEVLPSATLCIECASAGRQTPD